MKKMLFLAALVLGSFSAPSHAAEVAKCICIGPPHAIGNHRCMNHFVFLQKIYLAIDPQNPQGLRAYIGDQQADTLISTGKAYDPASGFGCIRE
jgi:uncharacterized protein involved in high-affinity Fe2+ transport